MQHRHLTVWLRKTITLLAFIAGACVLWQLYQYYVFAPQTRDGKITADVIPLATDVSGFVSRVYVRDNQHVHKGQLLLSLDKARLINAMEQANVAVEQARIKLNTARRENQRYQSLKNAISQQDQDNRRDALAMAKADLDQAIADQKLASINLQRGDLYAPVDGIVTNFSLRPGHYATAGQPVMALVDSGSFFVAGYFEETKLGKIRTGDTATIRIMGENKTITGHVESLAAGINDSERTTTTGTLLANVNPTFSWIRLAQRIPVRIKIDSVPEGVTLIAGRTVSVVIDE
ncbi:TPA: HlyD family secretion protein [Klebsiella pneumoniae]|nr:HlyD family secretion protein [Klebsiella pneumoniae]HBT4671011.1 HlyD family secretion protein [Klebsiella pneumoniae]